MTDGPAAPGRMGMPRRIVLTGFMGAGKSTVGRMLAARLDWPFLDIDALLVAEQGCSVADIFARHGEPHFRQLEAAMIARVLAPAHEHPHAIVALGGGAIETGSVRDLLDPGIDTVTVFLSAPLGELLTRCRPGAAVRPLLNASEPPEARLARRLPHYQRAHLTVETAGIPPDRTVERILDWLGSR